MPIDGHSLLILTQIPGIGPHRLRLLVAHFGTLEAVLRAAPRELAGVEGVDAKTASLIAGIYGMNFERMPELKQPWGYAYSLGLMVVAAVIEWVYFKRKGWF